MTNNADGYNTSPNFYNGFGNPDLNPSAQNPTIIPSFDPYLADPVQGFVPPSVMLELYPRVNAVGSVTLGGSVTAGDTVAIDIVNGLLPNGIQQVATIAIAGDTLSTLAARLAALINQNPFLMQYPVLADVVGPVVTLYWEGPTGNFTTLTGWSFSFSNTLTVGGTATAADVLTLTFASPSFPSSSAILGLSGTATVGDVATITFANPYLPNTSETVTFTVAATTLSSIATGLAAAINADTKLAALGMSANANNAQVNISWGAAYGNINIVPAITRVATETIALTAQNQVPPSALVPSPAPSELIVLGGTITTGDTIQLRIFFAGLPMPYQFQYVVQSSDSSLTILGQSLAAAINDNSFLSNYGFGATAGTGSTAGQVSIIWDLGIGYNVGFLGSVFATSGTIPALSASPSSISVSYAVAGGNSTTVMATALKNAINANVILAAAGLTATSSTNTVLVALNGALNPVTYTTNVSGSATETLTWGGATAATITITGSATAGNTIYAVATTPSYSIQASAPITAGRTTTQQATALAAAINASGQWAGQGLTATSATNVVTLTASGANELPTFTAFAQQAAAIFTLGGSATTGDAINVTVTNAEFSGGSYNFQYVVQSTDLTLTILATSITTAINNNPHLVGMGFVATNPSAGVFDIAWSGTIGPVTFAVSENGAEVVTVGGTISNGDSVVLDIHDAGLVTNPDVLTYNITGADTTTTIAAGLATLINADAHLQALGITASSALAVLTVKSLSPNATTYTRTSGADATLTLSGGPTETNTQSGTPTETLTVADSAGSETFTEVQPVGGEGVIKPQSNFVLDEQGGATNFWRGQYQLVDYNTLASIIAAGLPIT